MKYKFMESYIKDNKVFKDFYVNVCASEIANLESIVVDNLVEKVINFLESKDIDTYLNSLLFSFQYLL